MVLIGIGSNLGDSLALASAAISRLERGIESTLYRSKPWRTKPVGCPQDSPVFVNAVVAFRAYPGLDPDQLLSRLQEIEREFGRPAQTLPNAPRKLDLDLLVFDELIRTDSRLTLPHPRARERHFVLVPAAQLCPDLVWPGTNRTILELMRALPDIDWGQQLPAWP